MGRPNLIAKSRGGDNGSKLINKFSYYRFFSTGAKGPNKIKTKFDFEKVNNFSKEELNILIEQMFKHPHIFDINENTHEVTLSNISHGKKYVKELETVNIGSRIDNSQTYFYGLLIFKPLNIEDGVKLKELILEGKEFNFNNELKVKTIEILVKKTGTIAGEPIEVPLKKIDNIILAKKQVLSISKDQDQDLIDLINSRED